MLFFAVAGCGSRTVSDSFMREDIDFGFVQSVAVLPFANNSSDQYAPMRARDITITQTLALGLFDVVDKDLVDSQMFNDAIDPNLPIDPLALKRLGNRLRVQAFILGTVDLAEINKIGATSYPEMALTLRLVEAETGIILWQASGHLSGESFTRRLFGVKPNDSFKVTLDLVRALLRTAPAAI